MFEELIDYWDHVASFGEETIHLGALVTYLPESADDFEGSDDVVAGLNGFLKRADGLVRSLDRAGEPGLLTIDLCENPELQGAVVVCLSECARRSQQVGEVAPGGLGVERGDRNQALYLSLQPPVSMPPMPVRPTLIQTKPGKEGARINKPQEKDDVYV